MREILRCCVAVLSAVLALSLGAAPTAAADGIARVDREPVAGETIRLSDGTDVETFLYHLRVDGTTSLPAYCADISSSVDRTAAYTESSWATDPAGRGIDAGPVAWIAQNSYPEVDLERLRADSGIARLSRRQAIAGTQAAIWRYTNDIELGTALTLGDQRSAAVRALYDYLVERAEDGDAAPIAPSLAMTPDRIDGADPAVPLGPLRVRTSGESPVAVAVKGARSAALTDGAGTRLSEVPDGGEFFVEVDPAAPEGIATVYARAENALLAPGGLFTGKDGVRTQPLVTAGSGRSTRSVSAKVHWRRADDVDEAAETPPATGGTPSAAPGSADGVPPAPSPSAARSPTGSPGTVVVADDRRPTEDLGLTGNWAESLVLGGLVLLAAGAVVMYLARHRRRR
ncbi:TQXA domain-containing protein [Nocardiopsis mwathae]|uniref:TQXA domain-containing protein n=1 Tax=Nocardiopsis mwathae TaxID=1472723 RepID=A0A7W9YE19_9ACTN|nr:thioester domain-containing protein [Nocardiopsis mwathae]MBB6170413.1 TQXA domain-containing protein [Nocardiopsis mwathae]